MQRALLPALLLLMITAQGAPAKGLSQEFREAFENRFPPKTTHAVVMRSGLPTTSVRGEEGDDRKAHFAIDIKDGEWEAAWDSHDDEQPAQSELLEGEVLVLDSIHFRNDCISLRMESLEQHEIIRGALFKNTSNERVATRFRFYLPERDETTYTPDHLTEAVNAIEPYLKFFPDRESALAWADRAESEPGAAEPKSAPPRPTPTTAPSPAKPTPPTSQGAEIRKEIKVGMTNLQVLDLFGRPLEELMFEDTILWTYPDFRVLFEDGRVKDVRF